MQLNTSFSGTESTNGRGVDSLGALSESSVDMFADLYARKVMAKDILLDIKEKAVAILLCGQDNERKVYIYIYI